MKIFGVLLIGYLNACTTIEINSKSRSISHRDRFDDHVLQVDELTRELEALPELEFTAELEALPELAFTAELEALEAPRCQELPFHSS